MSPRTDRGAVRRRALAAALALLSGPLGLAQSFTDVTEELGLDFVYTAGPYNMNAGAAWFDYDGDGDLDLFVTDWAGGGLFRNELRETGVASFTDVTFETGANDGRGGQGVTAADYDNDGDADLFLSNFERDTLLRNQLQESGVATFVDVTVAAGLDDGDLWSQSSAWGDYDADGLLDLYVGGYIFFEEPPCQGGGAESSCERDRLYRNEGDGTFTNIAPEVGTDHDQCHFVSVWSDYDRDGDLDVWAGYDFAELTRLWRNDGPHPTLPWTFTELDPVATGIDFTVSDMGIAVGDVDRDGWLDYYHSNGVQGNRLAHNQGDGTFREIAVEAGVEAGLDDAGQRVVSWGDVIADFDHDGWRDIYVVNGYVNLCGSEGTTSNLYFHNDGDLTFTDRSEEVGLASELGARGLAAADFDEDGDLDLVVGLPEDGYLLLRNDLAAGPDRRWLKVLPVGRVGNRDAIGAWVELEAGGATFVDEVRAGSSLYSMNSRELEFGLGSRDRIERMTVTFLGGGDVELRDLEVDRSWVVPEPTVEVLATPSAPTLRPGEPFTLSLTVTSRLDVPQPARAQLALSPVGGPERVLVDRSPVPIVPGPSRSFELAGVLPELPPGPAQFRITLLDPASGELLEQLFVDVSVEP